MLKNILFNKENKYTGYDSNIVLELTIQDDRFDFCSTISTALKQAQSELQSINETRVNNPVPVSLLSGDRKPQIRFLGNHHSGSGNLYHKSFRM